MLDNYPEWEDYLHRSVFYQWLYDKNEGPGEIWDKMNRVILTQEDSDTLERLFKTWVLALSPKALLQWIDNTYVDGDSYAQLAIHEIQEIVRCDSGLSDLNSEAA